MSSVHAVLSDLFFNHDHGIQIDKIKNRESYEEHIRLSAVDFLDCYGPILACDLPTVEELVADFLRRV